MVFFLKNERVGISLVEGGAVTDQLINKVRVQTVGDCMDGFLCVSRCSWFVRTSRVEWTIWGG